MSPLVEQLRANDPALTSIDLVFEGDELGGNHAKENVNDLAEALCSNKTVTVVSLRVTQTEDEQRWVVPQWIPILRAVAKIDTLQDLSVSAFYDRTGKHTLRLTAVSALLRQASNLQKLTLDAVGFLDDDDSKCFGVLQDVCRQHESLQHLQITNYYFSQFRLPDWWSQSTRLMQAITALPTVTTLKLSSAAPMCRRPNLTLECLNSLFSLPTLTSLSLQDLVLWGSGSGSVTAASLRQNSKLEALELHSCILAGDESILAGLGGNTTLHTLDMTDSDLSMEAVAMAEALLTNKTLQSCNISKARLGGEEETHHANLSRIVRALEKHPALTVLDIQGMHSYIYQDGLRPLTFIRSALDSIIQVLQNNRVLVDICMDEALNEGIFASQRSDVNYFLGLNRSGYWELSQATSEPTEWTDSLATVRDEVGCLFRLLRVNPLLCQL